MPMDGRAVPFGYVAAQAHPTPRASPIRRVQRPSVPLPVKSRAEIASTIGGIGASLREGRSRPVRANRNVAPWPDEPRALAYFWRPRHWRGSRQHTPGSGQLWSRARPAGRWNAPAADYGRLTHVTCRFFVLVSATPVCPNPACSGLRVRPTREPFLPILITGPRPPLCAGLFSLSRVDRCPAGRSI